jgi:hypothetical protein
MTRWVVAALLVLTAGASAYLAAFHTWAATGPPTPDPAWHMAWAQRFFWAAVALLIVALVAVLAGRRKSSDVREE